MPNTLSYECSIYALKNFQAGYTYPLVTLQQNGESSNMRVFVSIENLFTITKMPKQFDQKLVERTLVTAMVILCRRHSHLVLT